ncbi:MAG: chemotaxis protein CheW [Treponema sp.]|nr:chemotaxis protein CheW [Spirochaetales bacterium]MDY4832223.1 chemotaxis protein CheW [Treponema sp.]MDY5918615.1 chemotaxis protein CheW [Treponema sp.]MDY6188997.1 chemotaxis protein CheW [Treponema sp.]
MAAEVQFQLVTFRLGEELYGVNIMDVKEIVRLQNVRVIPNAPYYVEGIIKLRSEIIPIIDLHKRFNIQSTAKPEDIEMEGGFIILDIEGSKIGIIIDKVERVVTIKEEDVKEPPQMLSGIGNEYIEGVVREEHGYLIMLNTRKLFNASELQKIIDIQ